MAPPHHVLKIQFRKYGIGTNILSHLKLSSLKSRRKQHISRETTFINLLDLIDTITLKFLGVHIDSRFVWDKQISTVKRKLYNIINIMYKIKEKVDSDTLITVYNTLMLPHLSYCCEIWGNTYGSRLPSSSLLTL